MTIKPVMQFATQTFKSPSVNGLQLVEKLHYIQKPTRPTIMTKKLSMDGKTLAEFSQKELGNGLKLETYESNGSTIKLVKNKFGDFIAFKTNIEDYRFGPQKLVEHMQEAIRAKFSSFLEPELIIQKNYRNRYSEIMANRMNK